LRVPSGAEAEAQGGASGQRVEEEPSSAAVRVQEAGTCLVPLGTSLGPEGLRRGARCRPPAPHYCHPAYGQRPPGSSGQGAGPSFPAAPPAPGRAPAAELLVPEAFAPPGSPGKGVERPRPGALGSARTEQLLPDPPAQLQEEPVDPQPPPHHRRFSSCRRKNSETTGRRRRHNEDFWGTEGRRGLSRNKMPLGTRSGNAPWLSHCWSGPNPRAT
ncbi:hypothetical protein EI555_008433, partial [Monodon monoceros]